MTKKKDTKQGLLRFDPTDVGDGIQTYKTVTITNEEGEEVEALIPLDGSKSEEQVAQEAQRYALTMRRVEDGWIGDQSQEDEGRFVDLFSTLVANELVAQLFSALSERMSDDEMHQALGVDFAKDQTAYTNAVVAKYKERIVQPLLADEQAFKTLERNVAANILDQFEAEYTKKQLLQMVDQEYGRLFSEKYQEMQQEVRVHYTNLMAQRYAERILVALNPSVQTLDALVDLLKLHSKTDLKIGTSKIASLIHQGIMSDLEIPIDQVVMGQIENIDKKLVDKELRVQIYIDQEGLDIPLEEILKRKENRSAILKMHIDLVNQALEQPTSGGRPQFHYRLQDALERFGHSRRSDGSFHAETMESARKNLKVLMSHQFRAIDAKTKRPLGEGAYWLPVFKFFDQEDASSSNFDLEKEGASRPVTSVLIEAGVWWQLARMSGKHPQFYKIPQEILQLDISGNGNEPNRLAIDLAAYLGRHVRSNIARNGGGDVFLKVGTMLVGSYYMTREEFLQNKHANRIRNYLFDESKEKGALAILRYTNAFDVTIEDQKEFFASGKGWKQKFWNARVRIAVPTLEQIKGSARKSLNG